jgi:hypothetical protein
MRKVSTLQIKAKTGWDSGSKSPFVQMLNTKQLE